MLITTKLRFIYWKLQIIRQLQASLVNSEIIMKINYQKEVFLKRLISPS